MASSGQEAVREEASSGAVPAGRDARSWQDARTLEAARGARATVSPRASGPSLACSIAYAANSGFAWTYIEGLCARIAGRLAPHGVTTHVCYPAIPSPPTALAGSPAHPVVLDFGARDLRGVWRLWRFCRRERVQVLYLSDVASFDARYAVLRTAGVRRIVVHSHGSGAAPRPTGVRRLLKRVRARLPWFWADHIVTVSDFVARREREAALTPERRLQRIWNAIALPDLADAAERRAEIRAALGIRDDATVVCATSRAAYEKGIDHLIRAVDMVAQGPDAPDIHLVFVGDGVDFADFRALAESVPSAARMHLVGRRSHVGAYLKAADIIAAPSVYEEALALAILEGCAHAKPVIVTSVGGSAEMVRDEQEGLVVPRADATALAAAIRRLMADPAAAAAMGARGRARAAQEFDAERMMDRLVEAVWPARERPAVGAATR